MDTLNPEQKQAVLATNERILVMAPVGTGKTGVLALRAGCAIDGGIDPSVILCLSFTNRAAREVRERLTKVVGKTAEAVTAKTFHAVCASIIRAEADGIGIDHDYVVWDEEDQSEVIKRLIRRFDIGIGREDLDRVIGCLSNSLANFRLAPYEGSTPDPFDRVVLRNLTDLKLKRTALTQDFHSLEILDAYVTELRENHALDFVDLIIHVSELLKHDAEALARWQDRFQWIQVDEIQDTNWSEYSILSALAMKHRRLSLFGDIDQTIYEWRGSVPARILAVFKKGFAPVREVHLKRNYRSTQKILEACNGIIGSYKGAVTRGMECYSKQAGEPVTVHAENAPEAEALWLSKQVRALQKTDNCKFRDFAILTRTNSRAAAISSVLEREAIPHFVVDRFRFFSRAEIKDAVAHLRFLLNPYDSNAFRRILQRPPKKIGEGTIDAIQQVDNDVCLRLVDFVHPISLQMADPYAPLVDGFASGKVIIFDVESTGLDTATDEVVELAASRVGRAGRLGEFHAYLRNTKSVGDSFTVHGLSDEFLALKGRHPMQVFGEFLSFCEGCVPVGHNVSFDSSIVESHARRAGIKDAALGVTYDTLDIARRLYRLPSYTLQSLYRALQLRTEPTHHAEDDVRTTEELLEHLVKLLEPGASQRRKILRDRIAPFVNLAGQIEQWRSLISQTRPHELLTRVLEESGLAAYWGKEEDGEKRQRNLDDLIDLFERFDDPGLSGKDALQEILLTVSLGNDAERLLQKDDRVLLLTVHQAKGLEFSTVFVAGATDNEFPSWLSKNEGRIDEEHRLFYVAASRAKERLVFSYHRRNEWGFGQQPSRFLQCLPDLRAAA
jgi:DNA helicase-2/ATP-dependent DNA helicase PcrA